MKQKVRKITLTGTAFNKVEFTDVCGKWMIKNFGENPIYVSFDNTATDDETIRINGGYYQVVVANEFNGGLEIFKSNEIYIKGTANDEVEVQQLCFH